MRRIYLLHEEPHVSWVLHKLVLTDWIIDLFPPSPALAFLFPPKLPVYCLATGAQHSVSEDSEVTQKSQG